MKVKLLVIALVVLTVLNLATIGTVLYYSYSVHPWGRGWHRGKPLPLHSARPGLLLSPQQRKKLLQIHQQLEAELLPLKQQLDGEKRSLADLIARDVLDTLAVRKKLATMARLQTAVQLKAITRLHQIVLELPVEQRKVFFERVLAPRRPRFRRGRNPERFKGKMYDSSTFHQIPEEAP